MCFYDDLTIIFKKKKISEFFDHYFRKKYYEPSEKNREKKIIQILQCNFLILIIYLYIYQYFVIYPPVLITY